MPRIFAYMEYLQQITTRCRGFKTNTESARLGSEPRSWERLLLSMSYVRSAAAKFVAAPEEWAGTPSAIAVRRLQPMPHQSQSAGATRRRTAGQQRVCALALWMLSAWSRQSVVQAATVNVGPIGASSQTLLRPLSTFVQPRVYLGTDNVLLGNTTFR